MLLEPSRSMVRGPSGALDRTVPSTPGTKPCSLRDFNEGMSSSTCSVTRSRRTCSPGEASDHLGDGGGAVTEAIGQTCLDDGRPLLLELVHGLEVLLDRGMEAVGHLHNPAAVITKSVAKPASTPSSRPHMSSSRKPNFWATHRSWTTT